ncbi:MAG: hypothetical protein JO189_07715, partial [Deltaproteobacteria bacterium]|nr:hypothetical protein [Deltaproteobacteria bacterium]
AGKRKIDRSFFDKIKIHYISYHPLDCWIDIFEETFPRIDGNPATSNYVVYKVSVATTEIENTLVR